MWAMRKLSMVVQENWGSFAAGLLLARGFANAVQRGSWLMSAAVGEYIGGISGAAIFVIGGVLVHMLMSEKWENGKEEKVRGTVRLLTAVVYAISCAVQCAERVKLEGVAAVGGELADCVVIAVMCAEGRGRVWGIIAAVMVLAAGVAATNAMGLPCDGKPAALLIDISAAFLVGNAAQKLREGAKAVPLLTGVGAAMVIDLFR